MDNKPIYVTKPAMPSLSDFYPLLEKIWDSQILTNNGVMHQDLEKKLSKYLNVPYISLFNNATIALIVACKALDLKGEVITTPFTFIATAQALLWNQLKPVFVDIEHDGYNIDIHAIRNAITPNTSAILPVHCFGFPCKTSEIQEIANQHNLKIIYDAAHAFGIEDDSGSILNVGDLSVISFHATKVFNTFEGGAIVSHSLEMKQKIDRLRNFGFEANLDVIDCGLNGKLNEVSSAFGLVQLDYINIFLEKRKHIYKKYLQHLSLIEGIRLYEIPSDLKYNYSYFPILVEESFPLTRDVLYDQFIKNDIFVRRYFYPLLTDLSLFSYLSSELKNAKKIAEKIICLPLYPDLTDEEQGRIIDFLKSF